MRIYKIREIDLLNIKNIIRNEKDLVLFLKSNIIELVDLVSNIEEDNKEIREISSIVYNLLNYLFLVEKENINNNKLKEIEEKIEEII